MKQHRNMMIGVGLLLCVAQTRAQDVGANIVSEGTVTTELGAGHANIYDQDYATQADLSNAATSWCAVVWSQPRSIGKVIFEQTKNYVVKDFHIQVAREGVTAPSGGNDADWETLPGGDFLDNLNTATPSVAVASSLERYGVRVLGSDKSNIRDKKMRPRELWVFEHYRNLALDATIDAPGWTAASAYAFNDERFNAQTYTPAGYTTASNVTFTWTAPKEIGAILIHGGADGANQYLTDYRIEKRVGASWETIADVAGSTTKTRYHALTPGVTTDGIRLVISGNSPDTLARISEIMILGVTQPIGTVICIR